MDFDTYERTARANYADLANTFAVILTNVIRTDSALRLHQVQARAKAPSSLKKKLADRGISDTNALESDIKDLAGCRVIFYTNTDVTRFINSGLIRENFNIVEAKVHHPTGENEANQNLYMSTHYLLEFKPARLDLSEYSRFSGMRCEVQIQTILNHAWSEMEHDIIYKRLSLDGFGQKTMEAIDRRLKKVMRQHLLPAGFEFQKIASDFERLRNGRQLFDEDMLKAAISSKNNNERFYALERFAEYLPDYDDLQSEYDQILIDLTQAVKIARTVSPLQIETQYGVLPAKTAGDVMKCVADILETYRYLNVDRTFGTLSELFSGASTEDERAPLLNLAKNLSKHDLHVWKTHGPIVQMMLVTQIKAFRTDELETLRPLLVLVLHEILKPELSGTSNTSNTVTIHQGSVIASEELIEIRLDAIELLKNLFLTAQNDTDRRAILDALSSATITPTVGLYANELVRVVIENSRTITDFYVQIASTLNHDLLQYVQHRVLLTHQRYRALPDDMAADTAIASAQAGLKKSIVLFRERIDSNRSFGIYNSLVGFNAVFEPEWDADNFGWIEKETYRDRKIASLLDEVCSGNADEWLTYISNCASTRSDDLATFSAFGKFLTNLGETKPEILVGYFERMDRGLARFLPAMLAGLVLSPASGDVKRLIAKWITDGRYLPEIAWHLRLAKQFDENLLQQVVTQAIDRDENNAVLNALLAASMQFANNPGTLIDSVFLRAITFLASKKDMRWINPGWFPWRGNSLLLALNADQTRTVLDAMIPYPEITYSAEEIVATLALGCSKEVIDFMGKRQRFEGTDDAPDRYSAIPYRVFALQNPLAAASTGLIAAARQWFADDEPLFEFRGGRLLASVFPSFSDALREPLTKLVQQGNRQDIAFVLAVLRSYHGESTLYGICREIIVSLDQDDPLLGKIELALSATGVVCGEFGFSEAYSRKKTEIQPWLTDPSEKVRLFAASYIRRLDQRIAYEYRAAEESVALRKLNYGEELSGQA